MKKHLLCLLAAAVCCQWLGAPLRAADKIRVLVITGGHGFEQEPFFKLFKDNPAITFKAAAHPNAHALLKPEPARQYDVIVLYDMWQKITDEAKADFVARLKEGKGLVVLHHALGSYQDWPEYLKIAGGKYHLKEREQNGVKIPGSTYKHDVQFKVRVAAKSHPITRALQDFDIHDETYGNFEVSPEVTPLLTTDEPTSSKTVVWAKTYEKARVATIQLGHDHLAYENPSFKRLLSQAIAWTAPQN